MSYYALVKMQENALQKPIEQVIQNTLSSPVFLLTELAGIDLHEKNDQLVVIADKIDPDFLQGLVPIQQQVIVILFIRQPLSKYVYELATFPTLHLIMQNNETIDLDQLLVILKKNILNGLFKGESYLSETGIMVVNKLNHSEKRYGLIDSVSDFMEPYINNPRFKDVARGILEELLMNAFYSAPIDESGNRPFQTIDRAIAVELPRQKSITVKYSFNGRHLIISVKDAYGSFDSCTLIDSLVEYLKGELNIKTNSGGAGLGLKKLLNYSTSLIFHLDQGHFTEVISIIDLSLRYSKFQKNAGEHLGIFNQSVNGKLNCG